MCRDPLFVSTSKDGSRITLRNLYPVIRVINVIRVIGAVRVIGAIRVLSIFLNTSKGAKFFRSVTQSWVTSSMHAYICMQIYVCIHSSYHFDSTAVVASCEMKVNSQFSSQPWYLTNLLSLTSGGLCGMVEEGMPHIPVGDGDADDSTIQWRLCRERWFGVDAERIGQSVRVIRLLIYSGDEWGRRAMRIRHDLFAARWGPDI